MKGTISDFLYIGRLQNADIYRCPICFKEIKINEEDDGEYYEQDDNIYHIDCITDEMERLAVEFVMDAIEEDEFMAWYGKGEEN